MKPEQLRARVLAEWRGLPEVAERADRAVRCALPLQKLMKELGLGERLRAEEMIGAWRELVGDFLAKHSAPVQLKEGVLIIAVLQPVIHHQLDREMKRTLLERLRARFGRGAVRDLKFRLG